MDIAEVSMALANASVLSQVGTAVLDKALDASRELGAGMVQILDAAAMEKFKKVVDRFHSFW